MDDFDFSTRKVSIDWLSHQLRINNLTTADQSIAVLQSPWESGQSNTSFVDELTISSEDTSRNGNLPVKALVKTQRRGEFGAACHEVRFYQLMNSRLPGIPRYLGSAIDEVNEQCALVIEKYDIELALVPYVKCGAPPLTLIERTIDALAGFHAQFWNIQADNEFELPLFDRAYIDFIVGAADFRGMVDDFLIQAEGLLNERQQRVFEQYVDVGLSNLKTYLDRGQPQTLLHFDTHFYNFLVPVDEQKPVWIIDWANWQCGPAVHDLINNMIFDRMTTDVLAREQHLKARYLTSLQAANVSYDKASFEEDYRWGLVRFISNPVLLCATPQSLAPWKDMIEPLFALLEANDCWSLVE
jgi:hypothetical protein